MWWLSDRRPEAMAAALGNGLLRESRWSVLDDRHKFFALLPMTDELAPTPVKKRKRVHKGTPPSEKPGPTKKLKSISSTNDRPSAPPKTKRPVQKNAEAGPSSQKKSNPSGTPARLSSRVSRPTMKKVAALTMSKKKSAPAEVDLDSTDSSRTPSPNVSSRNSLKKQPTFDEAISKCELTPKRKVHLGAIELSSGSEEDICRRPPKKRVKSVKKPPSEIIDLCSDDDPPPKKAFQNRTDSDDVVVILSTDDEDELPVIPKPRAGVSQVKPALLKEIRPGPPRSATAQSPPVSANADVEEMARIPDDDFLVVDSVDSPRPGSLPSTDTPRVELKCSVQHPDVTLGSLQASYKDAMDSQIFDSVEGQNNRTKAHVSPFSTASFSAPPRVITFSDDVPTLCLQTPNYFSRTISSINRSASVNKKSSLAISIETDIPLLVLANVSQPVVNEDPSTTPRPRPPSYATKKFPLDETELKAGDGADNIYENRFSSVSVAVEGLMAERSVDSKPASIFEATHEPAMTVRGAHSTITSSDAIEPPTLSLSLPIKDDAMPPENLVETEISTPFTDCADPPAPSTTEKVSLPSSSRDAAPLSTAISNENVDPTSSSHKFPVTTEEPELSWTSHDFDHGINTATHAVDHTAPLKEPFSRCQSVPNQEPQEPSHSKTSSSNDDPLTEILSMTGEIKFQWESNCRHIAWLMHCTV
ncbi:hypothetical protein GALMADRAFT_837538 [Galerina marginata CBS 339.88]|uniref:Uncharacterized protein n=1 Tax=Galerina marginata (strain CBS 339.88) TaxID=685588 RepID=A0A067TRW1_GALM3|nr:hypothetical protein GALMADRAFT_837538 [Galerina marginata CBS 339.88]